MGHFRPSCIRLVYFPHKSTEFHVKRIEMLRNLAEKDEPKKEKDDDIDDNTKEVEIKEKVEVAETDNDELVFNDTNDAPPPQDAMTTTTAASDKEGEDEKYVRDEDYDNDNDVDDTKGGEEGGAIQLPNTAMPTKTTTKRT